MSDHVQDGVLLKSSPTDIESHDPTTPFGCRRRWWYKRVMGLPEPSSPSQALGTAFHALVEHYLDPRRKKPEVTPQLMAMFNSARWAIDEVKPRVFLLEEKCELTLAGVQVNGRVDVVTTTGILDWKTSSDPQRYGKTAADLRKSIQMGLYGAWAREQGYRVDSLEHVTIPTKRGETAHTKTFVSHADLDNVVARATLLLESMKETAKAKRAEDVAPDREKCGRCPFVSRCPTGGVNIMAMLSLFGKTSPAPESKPSPAPVLPPDAPPRKMPMVEAKPPDPEPTAPPPPVEVEAAPAPELVPPPRKRGRPPGAKNKPKDEIIVMTEPVEVPVAVAPAAVKITKVSVSHGLTVNLGKFNSARVDVTLEAEGGPEALAELHAKAKAEVAKQVEEYLKAGGGDAPA